MNLTSLTTNDWHARAAACATRPGISSTANTSIPSAADASRSSIPRPAPPLCEVSAGTAADVDAAVAAAKRSFAARVWSRKAPRERVAVLANFAR